MHVHLKSAYFWHQLTQAWQPDTIVCDAKELTCQDVSHVLGVQELAGIQHEAYQSAQATYTLELQQRFTVPDNQQLLCRQIMFTVYHTSCQQLERDHAALLAADRENSRILNNRQVPLASASQKTHSTMLYSACQLLSLNTNLKAQWQHSVHLMLTSHSDICLQGRAA